MRQQALLRQAATVVLLATLGVTSFGCGDVARSGRSPAMLIIEMLEASKGNEDDEFTTNLLSDVQTLVETTVNGQTVRVPTIFNDLGRVRFRLALKNPGVPTSPLGPTTLNEITVTRYRVVFVRSDGRNTPGVDVPYGFDGAFTVTVPANGNASAGFDLVRHQAKVEPPLRNLVGLGGAIFISTIAEITFWGRDQAGNEVTVTGALNVNFGDWADPE
jgi:hypothetical protein